MDAKVYNEKRRILFSTVHNPSKGFEAAFEYLEGYYSRGTIDIMAYVGLKAELSFYQEFRKEYNLTVAGDMGEHVDFCGMVDKKIVRIDVTTNVAYKKMKDYEPFLCEGYDYRLAIFDKVNFNLIDVLDLAFPHCPNCGDSHSFPFLVLLGENFGSRGSPELTNDQILIDICPACGKFENKKRYRHYGLQPVSYHRSSCYELEFSEQDTNQKVDSYSKDVYSFAKKLTETELMGLAENSYKMTGHRGEGEWVLHFPFKNGVVGSKFNQEILSGLLE